MPDITLSGRDLYSCFCKDFTSIHPFSPAYGKGNIRLLLLLLSCLFSSCNCSLFALLPFNYIPVGRAI